MKPNLILILCLAWGVGGCHVYKPIEKTTVPDDLNLTEKENLFRQFFYLKSGESILVTTKRGKKVPLEFQMISPDTLYANYRLPSQNGPVKVPLIDIQEAKRLKYSKGLTFLADALGFIFVTSINLLIHGEAEYTGEED